jgi:micrococcal nuclease
LEIVEFLKAVFIPKRFFYLAAGAALLLIFGVLIAFFLGGQKENVISEKIAATSVTPAADLSATPEVNGKLGELVRVVRVIDGDTIEIENGERVRYIGIDAPETVDPRKSVQCFGIEASKKNREMVEGRLVRLEKDITDRDKYNRLLRYVWIGDMLVNLELVKQGFAYSYSYPPDVKYQDQFLKAQEEARRVGRGLWGACPASPEPAPTPPVSYSFPRSSSCLIKGNISAGGEKIYHLPECSFYAKTKIEEARGERWFCSELEAQAAGWRKALNCP